MKYIEGTPREQIILIPTTLDEIIEPDNPVRFIDAYVEGLKLSTLGFKEAENRTGRPPYRPGLMLKIYIYCYLNHIRSSRRIAREVKLNKELEWLVQGLTPDFHTIAEFRRINHHGLRALFREFLETCWKLDLIDFQTVGIDGTKLRAQNNINNVFRRETIDDVTRRIDEKIDEYMKEIDTEDRNEQSIELDRKKVEERIESLKRQRGKAESAKKQFDADEDKNVVFATDEDARMMNDKGKIRPGYNAQTAIDAKHKLIVASEVTDEANDRKQMAPMLETVRETKTDLGSETRTMVQMDAGYHSEENIMLYKDDAEFDIVVSTPKDSPKAQSDNSIPRKEYRADEFAYEKRKNQFICPEGKILSLQTETKMNGKRVKIYKCADCDDCSKRQMCTRNENGRTITISENHEDVELFREKMKSPEYKKAINQRKELCEHPFGTIKRNFGFDHFLLRSMDKVKSEFRFTCFIYNMRRCLSIMGTKALLAAQRAL